MRSSRATLGLVPRLATVASLLLASAPAFADQPTPADAPAPAAAAEAPAPEPTTPSLIASPVVASPVVASPVAEPDRPVATADEASREGLRLALDLGFERAFGGSSDRLNTSSPTLLPIGGEVSYRASKTFMIGVHGYAALASRDDCISVDNCRARAYGFGAHIEGMLARGHGWVIWLRYGIGYELLYQGGQPLDPSGHIYRDAIDLVDLRAGMDFTIHRGDEGKTARIGPFLGLVAGTLVNQSGLTHMSNGGAPQQKSLDSDSGAAHFWFAAGVRATLDP